MLYIINNCYTFSQEGHQDDSDNMQEMDILDMNILDETENDNAVPEVDNDEDADYFHCNDDEMLNDEHDFMAEDEAEAEDPEVRNYTLKPLLICLLQLPDWQMLNFPHFIHLFAGGRPGIA